MIDYIEYIGSYEKANDFFNFCKSYNGTAHYAKEINGEIDWITIDKEEMELQLEKYRKENKI